MGNRKTPFASIAIFVFSACLGAFTARADEAAASLMSMNFIADYTGAFHGPDTGDDDAFEVMFRPAIPFTAFGRANILRITIPYQVSGRGNDGLGDVSIFDIVVTNESWVAGVSGWSRRCPRPIPQRMILRSARQSAPSGRCRRN